MFKNQDLKDVFYNVFYSFTINLFIRKICGHHSHTKLHMHAKFQVWTVCSFNDSFVDLYIQLDMSPINQATVEVVADEG